MIQETSDATTLKVASSLLDRRWTRGISLSAGANNTRARVSLRNIVLRAPLNSGAGRYERTIGAPTFAFDAANGVARRITPFLGLIDAQWVGAVDAVCDAAGVVAFKCAKPTEPFFASSLFDDAWRVELLHVDARLVALQDNSGLVLCKRAPPPRAKIQTKRRSRS